MPRKRTVPAKVTSPEMSSLAASYMHLTPEALINRLGFTNAAVEALAVDIQKLAACVLSQDETTG